jgi:MazG family protein
MSKAQSAIEELLAVMARLRAPDGCPWDREQTHLSLRFHAVEEVYELMDAIEAGDDQEIWEELGDLLLQVVFHCQLAQERGSFDFDDVARHIAEKLVRRHPHVFGKSKVNTVRGVWTQWERIKKAEKHGTRHARASALDGIPKHLPSLLRAEKLVRKATKAKLLDGRTIADETERKLQKTFMSRRKAGEWLFAVAQYAHGKGWSAEDLLRAEIKRQERRLRQQEVKLSRHFRKIHPNSQKKLSALRQPERS